ncbi:MAG: protein translocase subunit SecF [Candidatus Bipolaricaulia bacterium]
MFNIDFLGKARIWTGLSILLVLVSIVLVFTRGMNSGIDFTGGTQIRIQLPEDPPISQVRDALREIQIRDVDLSTSVIQDFRQLRGVKTITMKLTDEEEVDRVVARLQEVLPGAEILERQVIGTKISQELANRGWQAVALALIVILVYVAWRFRLKYAVAAIAALIHDVAIAVGIFSAFQIEVNLPIIAALLTIVGYSLNDTIVIFDRVRENEEAMRRASYFDVINRSINQSLSRTIHTSLTTFIPVAVLFFFGGSVLKAFSLALLIGVVVGTYSSIYVANPIIHTWTVRAAKAV